MEASCAQCGKSSAKLKKCSLCKQVAYCNVDCQRAAWKEHKPRCQGGSTASSAAAAVPASTPAAPASSPAVTSWTPAMLQTMTGIFRKTVSRAELLLLLPPGTYSKFYVSRGCCGGHDKGHSHEHSHGHSHGHSHSNHSHMHNHDYEHTCEEKRGQRMAPISDVSEGQATTTSTTTTTSTNNVTTAAKPKDYGVKEFEEREKAEAAQREAEEEARRNHLCIACEADRCCKNDMEVDSTLDAIWSEEEMHKLVPIVMEKTNAMYERIVEKGKRDNLPLDPEMEADLRQKVLRETLIRELVSQFNSRTRKTQVTDSKQPLLLADPRGYQGRMDLLSADTIRSVMETGIAVQENVLGSEHCDKIRSELEFLEYDGQFNEIRQQTMNGTRSDRVMWLKQRDVAEAPGLKLLMQTLFGIAFEMNLKARLALQIGTALTINYFNPNGAFYRRHFDGGYGDMDTGRKLTAIYFANPNYKEDKDGATLRLYTKGGEYVDIAPKGDRLVLLRSRTIEQEMLPSRAKIFYVTAWIPGPPDSVNGW
eukprot:GILJ01004957.1.p1 GENE.GILJ01004957.1~~GILJ01004957.1.p1  ORF type:complete len:535 (-),score=53.71 GILJ01004957.1:37-1641(-)